MRKNDENSNVRPFRTGDRYFYAEGRWWYTTREGDEGPFVTRESAEAHLRGYIGAQELTEKHQAKMETMRNSPRQGDPTIWDRQLDAL
ncbi:MAG: hypothetical protein GXP16_12145 [Gammaproteobacteria bacterium]|nr:hypothetical protein [Gammaproteobacteria bacterium]